MEILKQPTNQVTKHASNFWAYGTTNQSCPFRLERKQHAPSQFFWSHAFEFEGTWPNLEPKQGFHGVGCQMLWLVGVVADFVDNFNTGIMVRSGTEGRKGSWECCRLMRTVGCVWCRVHSNSYWIPTSKDLFVPSIALGFVHCSYSRANSVRKVNRRHETCRTAWLFRQRIESVPLEIIVDSNRSEAGIPMQNTLLRAKHAHTHTHLLRTVTANFDVECILRAKTLQLYLAGMGRWKDPREIQKATIAMGHSHY